MSDQIVIIFVDHGSTRSQANLLTESFVDQLELPAAEVHTCHMELADPLYADVLAAVERRADVNKLIVVPLFFVAGKHYVEDIERPLDALAANRPELDINCQPPLLAQTDFAQYLEALVTNTITAKGVQD